MSGETTAGGLNRIDWVLKQNVDVFILELGANDGLRGLPLSETRKNLQSIIDFVQKENPEAKIILAGMQIPPNLGTDYTEEFRQIFPELAEKENMAIIPFILEGVAGDPELNQHLQAYNLNLKNLCAAVLGLETLLLLPGRNRL